ncbi:MAG TPA: hypothetical protein VN721_01375 [Flavipsychrobacter sp.]|nr:hypothetical protein [Flavipsychrobacter sp.]
MESSIVINYMASNNQQMSIPLLYEMEDNDNIQLIRCRVNLPLSEIPIWLRPHKFEVRAMYDGNAYQVLFNETRGVDTIDAALFMDAAQEQLFLKEKRRRTSKSLI